MSRVAQKMQSLKFPDKWKNYWVMLARDYKDVSLDTIKTIKQKPLKSSIYGTLIASTIYCYKNNPDFDTFFDQLRKSQEELGLVHPDCQNPKTVNYLKYMETCHNQGVLRRLSIGVVSFLWIDNYNKELATYQAVCEYLKPEYKTFHERIVDVGFLNKWWNLEKIMLDYDINY